MNASLEDIVTVLQSGGLVRRVWSTGKSELVGRDGRKMPVDSKTYAKFLLAYQDGECEKIETGSLKRKDLVTEWRFR